MSLTAGVRLGPYEIPEPIGAGGMGEVHRAHDSRALGVVAAVELLRCGERSCRSQNPQIGSSPRASRKNSSRSIPEVHGTQRRPERLVFVLAAGQTRGAVNVVLNWTSELEHLVPTGR